MIDFAEEIRNKEDIEITFDAKTDGEKCVFSDGDGDKELLVIKNGEKKKVVIPAGGNGGILFIKKG